MGKHKHHRRKSISSDSSGDEDLPIVAEDPSLLDEERRRRRERRRRAVVSSLEAKERADKEAIGDAIKEPNGKASQESKGGSKGEGVEKDGPGEAEVRFRSLLRHHHNNRQKLPAEFRRSYVKKMRASNSRWSGLDRKQAWAMECRCLRLLEQHYVCHCRRKRRHFPVIFAANSAKQTIEMSLQGKSIRSMLDEGGRRYSPSSVDEQLDCICANMHRAGVQHLDMVRNGKNLCIDADGTISVIDFDIASVGPHCPTEKLEKRVAKMGGHRHYLESFRDQLRHILRKL